MTMPPSKKRVENGSWDRKKKAIIRSYKKQFKDLSGSHQIPQQNEATRSKVKGPSFKRMAEVYESKKAEREERKRIKEEKRIEREKAIKKYKKKKLENFKKLNQKTKWGQPVMKGRMEILLEKIQKSVADEAEK